MNYLLTIFLLSSIKADTECLDSCMRHGKRNKGACYQECFKAAGNEYSNKHIGSKLRGAGNGLNNQHKEIEQDEQVNQYEQYNNRGLNNQYKQNELDGQHRQNDNQYESFGQHDRYRQNEQASPVKGRRTEVERRWCYQICIKNPRKTEENCRHICYECPEC